MPVRISSKQRIRTEAALILGTQAMTASDLADRLADAGVTEVTTAAAAAAELALDPDLVALAWVLIDQPVRLAGRRVGVRYGSGSVLDIQPLSAAEWPRRVRPWSRRFDPRSNG